MPKLDARQQCLEAAVLIAETGFEYLTVQAVADRLGMTWHAVQYHFPGGRDRLRTAVVKYAIQNKNRRIIAQLKAMNDPALIG